MDFKWIFEVCIHACFPFNDATTPMEVEKFVIIKSGEKYYRKKEKE